MGILKNAMEKVTLPYVVFGIRRNQARLFPERRELIQGFELIIVKPVSPDSVMGMMVTMMPVVRILSMLLRFEIVRRVLVLVQVMVAVLFLR